MGQRLNGVVATRRTTRLASALQRGLNPRESSLNDPVRSLRERGHGHAPAGSAGASEAFRFRVRSARDARWQAGVRRLRSGDHHDGRGDGSDRCNEGDEGGVTQPDFSIPSLRVLSIRAGDGSLLRVHRCLLIASVLLVGSASAMPNWSLCVGTEI